MRTTMKLRGFFFGMAAAGLSTVAAFLFDMAEIPTVTTVLSFFAFGFLVAAFGSLLTNMNVRPD